MSGSYGQEFDVLFFSETQCMSLHYLVKYLCFKNDLAPEEIEANCHVRLIYSHTIGVISGKYLSGKYLLVKSVTKRRSHRPHKNTIINCTQQL